MTSAFDGVYRERGPSLSLPSLAPLSLWSPMPWTLPLPLSPPPGRTRTCRVRSESHTLHLSPLLCFHCWDPGLSPSHPNRGVDVPGNPPATLLPLHTGPSTCRGQGRLPAPPLCSTYSKSIRDPSLSTELASNSLPAHPLSSASILLSVNVTTFSRVSFSISRSRHTRVLTAHILLLE